MAQLQFRSDDTIKWLEGYGSRADGDATPSGSFSNPKTTFSGSLNANTGSVGSASGFAIGDIVLIHQSREGGDGAGNWQLNKITNIVGTTFTFKYNLTHNYSSVCQIIKINQNRNVTINSTLTVPAWNGSTGGIIVLMGDVLTCNVAMDAIGANGTQSAWARPSGGGFRGAQENDNQHQTGFRGEGNNSAGNEQTTSASGTGPGGGASPGGTGKSHGAGGGNGGAGTSGNNGAQGGGTGGDAGLTVMLMGAGGSSGSGGDNSNAGSGGNGGGIIILIFRTMTVSANLYGGVGAEGNVGAGRSYGGNGAGGSLLMKGQNITISSINANGGSGGQGGAGGAGRVHADYVVSISGSSSPAADTRQDNTLVDPGGAFLGLI